mmetsp:Transcript_85351/g.198443  ORF Transcript_85351/g.198443 Transcript_85351/m.198443 type:complete len:455 (-) Transcript_85351:87-1451(-)
MASSLIPGSLMTGSLMSMDRQYLYNSFRDGFQLTVSAAFAKDNHYTLFRYEDWPAWVTFTAVFVALIILDNAIMNRNPHMLTIAHAVLYTLFWVLCAGAFCCWVYYWYGANQALMWMSGYLLEWMLSFDNLFVFHLVFSVYATPDHLKHKPLYLGILGAVVFRLAFIFVGEYLMHAMFFMHFLFGAFLVYSGIKTMSVDDEEDDPSQQPLVQWLQRRVPFVSAYDEGGAFFVRVRMDEWGEPQLPGAAATAADNVPGGARAEEARLADGEAATRQGHYGTIDFADAAWHSKPAGTVAGPRGQLRATMLVLVVICIEISDMLFAVDSVSAIVAQVNDLFLAYTSAVFAMLGLRAMFFVIDTLVQLFSLLKYGVGAVLVFIGIKLIVERLYRIPPAVVCLVIVSCVTASMIASLVRDKIRKLMEEKAATKQLEQVAKLKEGVLASHGPATTKLHSV